MENHSKNLIVLAIILNVGLQVHAGLNAYANSIAKCVFNKWPTAVLSGDVACAGFQLCYSVAGTVATDPALFGVCYNTTTRIPDFTAHIVKPNVDGGGRSGSWHDEKGTYGKIHSSRAGHS